MKKITVLMSTYNGETFLDRQLKSIAGQTGLKDYYVKLICRDDGSSDKTVSVLKSWRDRIDIEIIEGSNMGARASFYDLLKNAPESDYYAFCDQDDIWLEDKLSRALSALTEEKMLYFSNVEYVDGTGNKIGRFLLAKDFELSLKRVLMCNPANGCVMVWDKALQDILLKIPYDTFTMHDEFLCTAALLFGKVVYDPEPSMYYRLHEQNVTQSNGLKKKFKLWRSIWFGRKEFSLDKRAKVLLGFDLKPEDKEILSRISSYKHGFNRFSLVKEYSCEEYKIQRSFKIRMILGLL